MTSTPPRTRLLLTASLLCTLALLSSCSQGTSASSSSPSGAANPYAAVYKAVTWASGVAVIFPSTCSMTVTSSGVPPSHNAYYLVPAANGSTVVATTPSGIQLAVMAYAGTGLSTVNKVSATFNICPVKASSTTAATGGAIGVITSGEVLFDPYEATSTVALSDNASYTFSTGGTTYTASFLDQCSSHPAGNMSGGSTWHYHANPVCYTPAVDGASGPSHILGIALDGFPIYGGRDLSGKVVDPTTLDACNGITSATPEFPSGAYHYVLPIDSNGNALTTRQSSLNCYAGTVGAPISAQMRKLACSKPVLLASGNMRLPDGREVTPAQAIAWQRETMPNMPTPNPPATAKATPPAASPVTPSGL